MGKYGFMTAAAVLLASVSVSEAALVVSAGDWSLTPNTGDQVIQVKIAGTGNVMSATVVLAVTGPGNLPSITGGEIITGTIFEPNHTDNPLYDFADPHIAFLDVATSAGTVLVDGEAVLATVTIDTDGMGAGPFSLTLTGANPEYGDTLVITTPAVAVTYENGSVAVPEPGTVLLLGMAGGSLLLRRRARA